MRRNNGGNLTVRLTIREREIAEERAARHRLRIGTYAKATLLGPAPARDLAADLAQLTLALQRHEAAAQELRDRILALTLKLVAGPPED